MVDRRLTAAGGRRAGPRAAWLPQCTSAKRWRCQRLQQLAESSNLPHAAPLPLSPPTHLPTHEHSPPLQTLNPNHLVVASSPTSLRMLVSWLAVPSASAARYTGSSGPV